MTIEGEDIFRTGGDEQTVVSEVMSFTRVDMSDVFGNPMAVIQATGDTLSGVWRMFMWDYSFFKATDDNPNTIEVTCSDKLDNKLSNKPDSDLAEIAEAWPQLPDSIRSAILTLVRASRDR